jgi:hypothetical protein
VVGNLDDGKRFLSRLTLANNGDSPLGKRGWALYFDSVQPVERSADPRVHVENVNGPFFRLEPTDAFESIRSGQSVGFELEMRHPAIKYSDAPDGAYFVFADADVKFRFRYPTAQRNDQRNPDFWNMDLMVAKDFALGKSFHLQASAEIFNVFNDSTVILDDRIDGTNSGVRRFGRRYQIGLRLAF